MRGACPDTPIIGTGGVSSGLDAVEMLMAGATAVGVGSAIYYRGRTPLPRFAPNWMAGSARTASTMLAIRNLVHRSASIPWRPPARRSLSALIDR